MSQSRRKLLGTVAILLLVTAYPLLGMELYARFLMAAPWWIAIPTFAVAGLLWFFPASWVIRWMSKPSPAANAKK